MLTSSSAICILSVERSFTVMPSRGYSTTVGLANAAADANKVRQKSNCFITSHKLPALPKNLKQIRRGAACLGACGARAVFALICLPWISDLSNIRRIFYI